MPFLSMLLTYVVSFIITELLRPKPDIENAKPSGLGDFQVPTATEGRAVPLIFGSVNIKGPNVVWYGDLRTEEITEEVSTGLFSSEDVTIGYEYYLGVQLALCRGPLLGSDDELINIRCDDSFIWGPKGPNSESPINPVDGGTSFFLNAPTHFGEADQPGQGGIRGTCRIYPGSQTQALSGYLSGKQTPLPAYRGTCYIEFRQIWIGNSPNLRNFEFELSRYPNGLSLANNGKVGDDANPMNVLYEILTNSEWGLNLSPTSIDVAALTAVAGVLETEGNGFSWVWDRAQDLTAAIKQIEEQVDGVLTQEPLTGVFTFSLIRDDYVPGTLELLDESNVLDVVKFRRPSWNSTSNVISIQFNDRRKSFATSYATAQDSANIDIVQSVNTSEVRFPGVKDAALANALAWRELRLLSYPIATGRLICNRTQYDLKPGDVRELTWDRLGLVRLPIRVTKIDRGNLLKGQIAIDFSEDIFQASPGSFADPSDTLWDPPDTDALPPLIQALIEIPYVFTDVNGSRANTIAVQIGSLVVRQGQQEIGYNKFTSVADFPTVPGDPAQSDVVAPGRTNGTTPYGQLTAPLDRGQTNGFQDVVGFQVDNAVNLQRIGDATAADLENLVNACLIDDEIILFSNFADLGAGVFEATNIIRGALDTLPADHANNADVFFFSYGLGLINTVPEADTSQNWKVRIQMFTTFSRVDFGLTTVSQITSEGRAGRAYPARNVQVNASAPGGGYFPSNAGSPSGAELVGLLALTWSGSDKFTQPRASAWDGPHVTQEAGTAFRIRIIEDPGGADTVKLDASGVPAGVTQGAYNAAGFADDTVTDLYQVEISSVSVNGESQVWQIGPFTIYGYGYKYDEKYGGDTVGVILEKGDPPASVDAIPGVTAQSVITITASGTVATLEQFIARVSFLETGQAVGQHERYQISGSGKSTPADFLTALANDINSDFDPIKVQAIVDGNVLTISTAFGSLGGTLDQNTADASITRIQDANGTKQGDQIVHFDLWEGDPATTPTTESLAINSASTYNNAGNFENVLDLQIVGTTIEARRRVPRNGLSARIKWGGRLVAPGTQAVNRDLPLRDGQPEGGGSPYDSSLLSQLQKFADQNPELIRSVDWTRFNDVQAGGIPADRVGVEVALRSNFQMIVADTYDSAPQNTIFDGSFGPLKLLGKDIVPGGESSPLGQNLRDTVRVIFQARVDDQFGFQGSVGTGQFYNVVLDGNTFTEGVIPADLADPDFRDGIYSRLKTQIDAFAGGSFYFCTLNTADRVPGGPTFVSSMDIEKLPSPFASFSASANRGLEIETVVEQI